MPGFRLARRPNGGVDRRRPTSGGLPMPCVGYSDALLASEGLVASPDGSYAAYRSGGARVAMPAFMRRRGLQPDIIGVPHGGAAVGDAGGALAVGSGGGAGDGKTSGTVVDGLVGLVGGLLGAPLRAARRELNR